MSTEIQVAQPQSILEVIANVAKDPNANLSTMERLVELQFRIMDEERTQALNSALARLEPKIQTLVKSKAGAATKGGQVKFYYTPYEDIDRMLRPALRECGLSLSFTTRIVGAGCYLVAAVQEVSKGGIREAMLPYMPDTNDQLSGPQKVSSGLSYAQRRAVALLFNLVFAGEDDDAQFAGAITATEVGTVERLLTECAIDRPAFAEYLVKECGVRDIALIPASSFKEIESKLKQRKARKA